MILDLIAAFIFRRGYWSRMYTATAAATAAATAVSASA
jgi:hypothetical protein